jgi:uncharacterized protein YkwD
VVAQFTATLAVALFTLTNNDRAAAGVPPLEWDAEAVPAAEHRAAEVAATQRLDHYRADGTLAYIQALDTHGIRYGQTGENLARGHADLLTPEEIEAALLASPPHRELLLDPAFDAVAIAVTVSGEDAYYVLLFRERPDGAAIHDRSGGTVLAGEDAPLGRAPSHSR